MFQWSQRLVPISQMLGYLLDGSKPSEDFELQSATLHEAFVVITASAAAEIMVPRTEWPEKTLTLIPTILSTSGNHRATVGEDTGLCGFDHGNKQVAHIAGSKFKGCSLVLFEGLYWT